MPRVPFWQIDAFTNRPFGGNAAAIVWLEQAADPAWMQSVASEFNLSETSFVRKFRNDYELRWFTPTREIDLCGHATLATAHAFWTSGRAPHDQPLRFHTRSGLLTCTPAGDFIELDFPALPAQPIEPPPGLIESMNVRPLYVGKSRFDYLVVVDSPDTVRSVRPNYPQMGALPARGVILTARGDGQPYDFQSRFFAPAFGVDEDPVCGSAHCCLATYWAQILGKQEFLAYQTSARGGILRLRLHGDRVTLGGQAVVVWQGELCLDPVLGDENSPGF